MARRTNGEGTIYKKADGRWCARYTFNGKRRDITGKTQAEVKRKLKGSCPTSSEQCVNIQPKFQNIDN